MPLCSLNSSHATSSPVLQQNTRYRLSFSLSTSLVNVTDHLLLTSLPPLITVSHTWTPAGTHVHPRATAPRATRRLKTDITPTAPEIWSLAPGFTFIPVAGNRMWFHFLPWFHPQQIIKTFSSKFSPLTHTNYIVFNTSRHSLWIYHTSWNFIQDWCHAYILGCKASLDRYKSIGITTWILSD